MAMLLTEHFIHKLSNINDQWGIKQPLLMYCPKRIMSCSFLKINASPDSLGLVFSQDLNSKSKR